MDIIGQITETLGVKKWQVEAAVQLLDEGNTIPFIARYRKEATGTLNDEQLRTLAGKLTALRNLEERKEAVLRAVEEQGKLTPEFRKQIEDAETLVAVEDLYRPYKQKRRTRGSIAAEKGLGPLADRILAQNTPAGETLLSMAAPFVTPAGADALDKLRVRTPEEALEGAEDIIAEQISDRADFRTAIRDKTWENGTLVTAEKKAAKAVAGSKAAPGKDAAPSGKSGGRKPAVVNTKLESRRGVYEMYFAYEEALPKIPGHRVLAINRGEKEGFLTVKVNAPEEKILAYLEKQMLKEGPAADPVTAPAIRAAIRDGYERLIAPSIENELRARLTDAAEDGAIVVFRENLRQLLLAPPIAGKTVLGWDPAFRTGCKIAVVDPTGKVLDTTVVFPTEPQKKVAETKAVIERLIEKDHVDLISLGNGTASRESEKVITEIIREGKRPVQYVIVNEAGASVYSASALATEEFPHFDVGQRSAASMARRLQDPLAELVKIDPKSVGVGQYQHDMNAGKLDEALGGVVEDCVNKVGVDLNTASFSLLSYVSGISQTVAKNIVAYREANGRFSSRVELLKVPKLGPKAYEQSAGFLRIRGGKEPLDNTAVHPEDYDAVRKLFGKLGLSDEPDSFRKAEQLVGNKEKAAAELGIGAITLSDILTELTRPGRDPREDMPKPVLRSDVLSMEDLAPGMKLKGTVRNIVDFGAFVDIGVHEDGLVHISRMTDRFIHSPMEVVHVGDVVDVWVLDVDLQKNRISLSMVDPTAPKKAASARPAGGNNASPAHGNTAKSTQAGKPVKTHVNGLENIGELFGSYRRGSRSSRGSRGRHGTDTRPHGEGNRS